MKHFSLGEWADFARNVAEKRQKAEMQKHLDSGCRQCGKALGLWTRVHEVAHREPGSEPPRSAVQMVEGMGAMHLEPRKTVVASLLFDSARVPAMLGVRSSVASPARQLLYGLGAYRIDLRIEPMVDSDKVSVVGQVLNGSDPAKHISGVPVCLLKAQKIVAESRTNRFGEFNLECDLAAQLRLELMLPLGGKLKIPLVEPENGPVVARPEAVDSQRLRSRKAGTRNKY